MEGPSGKSLEGKIALVTGGSRGIGRAVAVELARAGAFTFINYVRNEDAATETLKILENQGGRGRLLRFDVADSNAVQDSIRGITEEKGRIDILINNAGITLNNIFVRTAPETWDRVMDINLKGVFNCCRSATKYMMKQKWGRIINMTSVVATSGNVGQVCYSASKAGIIGLTKSLARELGPRNVCVNAVAPGFIETDMTISIDEAGRGKVTDQIPLRRTGTPDDVAGVVAFLVSWKADYITGQVIHVNGGLYM
ncbi:MAG TPA: 3-oxoacyl-[acyl-carrier-protein] reductase [Syntrophales bacterium]|nr:3-oxoacyl-[acyl-carrier-protein] reductase [Syntrophales bacterium]